MAKTNFRVGLIVPSSNVTMETEIPAMLRARANSPIPLGPLTGTNRTVGDDALTADIMDIMLLCGLALIGGFGLGRSPLCARVPL